MEVFTNIVILVIGITIINVLCTKMMTEMQEEDDRQKVKEKDYSKFLA